MLKKLAFLLVIPGFFMYAVAANDTMFPEVTGWKLKVNDQVYNSGDLWELINGAADIFLSYHFEDLHIAEYTKKDQMIRVELYRHKTLNDAYGIYTAERMPDYEQVSVGTQGYKSQGVLNYLAGNYYVKVMSAGIDDADEQTIALVAGKVDALLDQPPGLPEVLKLFPGEGQINLSDSYIAQNFMGYSFLHHAFSVKYEKPSGLQLFIVKLSPEEIQKMIDQYIQMMKEDKVEQRDGLYIIDDLFNGKVFLRQKHEFLIGVINTENEEIARNFILKTEAGMN